MSRLEKFDSIAGENWVVGRYLLPEIRRLGANQHGVLLDLACGESPFRCFFPHVDTYMRIDRDAIDPEVVPGDMLAIPLSPESVETVLLCQAITDVPHPIEVLKEVRRVLRPGGRLILFESMAYPEHDAPNDFYRLMPEGLRSLAADVGFHVEEFIYLGGLFTRFASLWNTFVMGGLANHVATRPIAGLGIVVGNLACYALDKLALHPRLASDYLAVLVSDSMASNRPQSGGRAAT